MAAYMASDISPHHDDPATERTIGHRSFFRSLKWHIISIAFVSVIGLAAFVLQVINDAGKEAALLKEIQSHSYPVQAHLLAAVHKLEFIHRELENAVTTGDEDTAIHTDQLADEFRDNLQTVGNLTRNPEIPDLLNTFETYHKESRQLALVLIVPYANIESLLEMGQKNSQSYFSLLNRLNELHRNSNDKFAAEISSATERATKSVRFAVIGGMLVLIMVVTIAILTADSIIRRITEMVDRLKSIALEDGDLKVRLKLSGADEMTELAFWFNKIITKLEDTSRTAENNILRIANTDELSGLKNRRYLMTWVQERINKEIKNDNFSAVFLDLDDFKPINDTFGHEVGDELIIRVAHRLHEFMNSIHRSNLGPEEPSDESVICRLGGDEFMLILPSITEWSELSSLIQHLCDQIGAPYNIDGIHCEVGVSIGVSRFPIDATDRGTLLDRADLAMYEAKRKGKRQFKFYEHKLEQKHGFHNALVQSLKNPRSKNELYLVYQPKFLIDDGSCIGAEALLRWDSPEYGLISPEVFIPLAEEKQLISEIDMWVLGQVCQQIHHWQQTENDPGVVALNISAQTLLRPQLTDTVAEVLQFHQIDPGVLQLEITESAVLDLSNGLTETISGLRKLGVSIAMDDFGAGHSSLKLLINNQIDLVKLDKSLIDEITTSTRQQQIVQSIITLAHSLDVSALAEGIERIDQLEYLRSVMCNEGQGYYFSLPLSAQEFMERFLEPDIKKVSGF